MDTRLGPVILRPYRPADFPFLFELDEICFEPPFRFSRAAMKRFAETRRARVVVAEADDKVIGFIIVHLEQARSGCAGYVVTLDVAPAFRRAGIAAALMHAAEADVRGEGCSSMLLHVYTGNHAAIAFYQRLGYVERHTVESFYGEDLDALVYRKHLQT